MNTNNEKLNRYCHTMNARSIVEIYSSFKGEVSEFEPQNNTIIYVNKGKLSITYALCAKKTISAGEFFFHPFAQKSLMESHEDYTITVLRFNMNLFFCDHYSLENLARFLQEKDARSFHILKADSVLHNFFSSIEFYIRNGVSCNYFYDLKQKEFMYLLKAFYTEEDLAKLFRPILNGDIEFANKIYGKINSSLSVKELANIFHYSYSGFEKRFKKVFGLSPNKWLQQERSKRIFHEINCSTKTILEIGYEFGFSSPSHFNDYCKRVFHQTPGSLRSKEIRSLV